MCIAFDCFTSAEKGKFQVHVSLCSLYGYAGGYSAIDWIKQFQIPMLAGRLKWIKTKIIGGKNEI